MRDKIRPMNVKLISAVSVAVVLGSSGVYYYQQKKVPTSDEFFKRNPHLTREVDRLPKAVSTRTGDSFQPGDFRLQSGKSYPVEFNHTLKMDSGDNKLVGMEFSGRLTLNSFGIKNKELVLLVDYNFTKVSDELKMTDYSKAQLGLKAFSKKLKSKAQTQILYYLDPAGKVLRAYTTKEHNFEEALELKAIALNMLFKRLPGVRPGKFSVVEADDTGIPYTMSYDISPAGGDLYTVSGKVLLTENHTGTPQKAAAAGAPDMALLSLKSDREQSFDWVWNLKEDRPVQQKMLSILELKFQARTISAVGSKANTKWDEPVSHSLSADLLAKFDFQLNFQDLLGRMGERVKNKDGKENPVKSVGELMGSLANVNDDSMGDNEKEAVFVELANALKKQPDMIPRLKDRALDAATGSREKSMLIGSLGFVGTPAAQAAMVQIYNGNSSVDEKQKVVTEMALSPRGLTPETKVFLRDVYDAADPVVSDVAGTAGLALGSSIAKDGDPATVKFLKEEYDKATALFAKKDNQEIKQSYLLTAMGNSKSEAFISEVKDSLDSESDEVRSAAVNSLRFAQDVDSRSLLFDSLKSDASEDVKVTAAQSLLYQPFDDKTQDALQDCTADTSASIKFACYRVLSSRIEQPGTREFLQSKASAETDPQIVNMINSALNIEQK